MRRLLCRIVVSSALICLGGLVGCSDQVPSEPVEEAEPSDGDAAVDVASVDPVVGSPSLLRRPVWRRLDGPPGGIEGILRVADTVYLTESEYSHRPVVAGSTDRGRSWREPNSSGIDAVVDRYGGVSAQMGGTWYLLSESVLYERASDGTWHTVGALPVRAGRLVATGGKLIAAGSEKLLVSDDGGESWAIRDGRRGDSVYDLFAWNGVVFVRNSDGLSVSRDFSESWESYDEDRTKPEMEDWIDAGSRLVAIEYHEDGRKLATSTDGINWHMVPIHGTDSIVVSLAMTEDGLLGITATGAVGRMRWHGGWSEITPGPWQFFRHIHDVIAIDEGLIGIDSNGIAFRWTEHRGWKLIEVGRAAIDELVGDGQSVWVQGHGSSAYQVYWREQNGWHNTEAGGSHLFAVDGQLYSAGIDNCMWRLARRRWDVSFQWMPDGPSSSCHRARDYVGGWISGVASAGDTIFVAHSDLGRDSLIDLTRRQYSPFDLDVNRGVYTLRSAADRLWIRTHDGSVYQQTDSGFVGRTPTPDEANLTPGVPVTAHQLETVGGEVYVVVSSIAYDDENIRVLRRRDDGWTLLPAIPDLDLPADERHRVISATESGLFSLNDDSVWYFSTLHGRWFPLDEGFPDDYIRDLEATDTAVYVSARRTRVWKLPYRR